MNNHQYIYITHTQYIYHATPKSEDLAKAKLYTIQLRQLIVDACHRGRPSALFNAESIVGSKNKISSLWHFIIGDMEDF